VAIAPCHASTFDIDHLPAECARPNRGDPDSQAARLTVTLAPDAPRVQSGGEVGASVVLTNTTSEALPVDVRPGCGQVELGAYDARGVRRDYVVADCGFGTGCGGPTRRVLVDPGGTLVKHVRFRAHVVRVSAASDCKDVDAGGLPPGRYKLRVASFMHGLFGQGPALDAPTVSAPLEVTR
jgi:hypothetical protein